MVDVEARSWRKLSPDSESQYKEGLEWHPSGQYLTYMLHGPEAFGAQIRRACLDGWPTDLMIDQADHWDSVGVWSPEGGQFYFDSVGPACRASGKSSPHRFDPATGEITHDLGLGFPPVWSRDGWTTAHRHPPAEVQTKARLLGGERGIIALSGCGSLAESELDTPRCNGFSSAHR